MLTVSNLSGQIENMLTAATDGNLNDGSWHTIRIKCEANSQHCDQLLLVVDQNSASYDLSKLSAISRRFARLSFDKYVYYLFVAF